MQQRGYQSPTYRTPPPPPPRGKGGAVRLLPWLLIVVAVALLAWFGIKALRDRQVADEVAPYEHVFADNISIDGINLAGMTAQQAYDTLYQQHQSRVNSWTLNLTYRGHTYTTVNYPTLGITVNTEQLNQQLREAWDLTHTGDAYQKKAAIERLRETPFSASTTRSEISDIRLDQLLQEIARDIGGQSTPTDAKLIQFVADNPDPFIIQREIPGYALNVQQAKEQILAQASQGISGDYELTPEVIMPSVTEAMLRENMVLRSTAQTAISSRSEENRNMNIRVSLGKINNMILKPGEVFSFNKTAGRRTHENGYFDALEQVSGTLVTGIGGGVCQSSTTIFQAALLANLTIVDRSAHGEPVGYTDPGLDATVYYYGGRQIDFKFKNSTSHDLYIAARVKAGGSSRQLITEIRIYGEPLGEGVQYKLSAIQRQVLPPPTDIRYVDDKDALHVIYKDEEELKQAAKEGQVVETYLQKFINGQQVEEKMVAKSTYPARQEQRWRGVKTRPAQ